MSAPTYEPPTEAHPKSGDHEPPHVWSQPSRRETAIAFWPWPDVRRCASLSMYPDTISRPRASCTEWQAPSQPGGPAQQPPRSIDSYFRPSRSSAVPNRARDRLRRRPLRPRVSRPLHQLDAILGICRNSRSRWSLRRRWSRAGRRPPGHLLLRRLTVISTGEARHSSAGALTG